MNQLVNKLNDIITSKGFTNYKIAKCLNISETTIANYRNGITSPSINFLEGLSELFGVHISYFFSDNGNSKINNTAINEPIKNKKNDKLEDQKDELIQLLKKLNDKNEQLLEKEKTIEALKLTIQNLEKNMAIIREREREKNEPQS